MALTKNLQAIKISSVLKICIIKIGEMHHIHYLLLLIYYLLYIIYYILFIIY